MNIKVENQSIHNQLELSKSITKEVACFCISWKKVLDELLDQDIRLDIYRKKFGYEVRYKFQDDKRKWFFQLELYYPNLGFKQKISYLKINRYITLPTNQGSGREVFNQLLVCCNHFEALEMIRLRSVRQAIGFWERQKFREQSDEIDWIRGDSIDYDLQCLKKPKSLIKCQYIYDFKKCDCPTCITYIKKNE